MKVTGVPDFQNVPSIAPCRELLDGAYAIIDTRSPSEFAAGHLPHAHSLPLFDDAERAVIGTLYKQQGQAAAIQHGLETVHPKLTRLVEDARNISEERPILVHCWRGGMRSGSVAWLLAESGMNVLRLEGGYKAYRKWVRTGLSAERPYTILGGMTGVGKTEVLRALAAQGEDVLDLEGIARHFGSAFGNLDQHAQPTSEQFANDLHARLVLFETSRRIWVEDESRRVGRVHVPEELHDRLRKAGCVELTRTDEERVQHLCVMYGQANREALKAAFRRIERKLGGQHVQAALRAIDEGDLPQAAAIGLRYYDKLYRHTQARYQRHENITFDIAGKTPEQVALFLTQGGF